MEVCGYCVHLIAPHWVGEPPPERSSRVGFFTCLGTTFLFLIVFILRKKPPCFHQQRDNGLHKSQDVGQLCRDLCGLLRSVVEWTPENSFQHVPSNTSVFQHWFRSLINVTVRDGLFSKVTNLSFRQFKWYFKRWCDWQRWGITISLWRWPNS